MKRQPLLPWTVALISSVAFVAVTRAQLSKSGAAPTAASASVVSTPPSASVSPGRSSTVAPSAGDAGARVSAEHFVAIASVLTSPRCRNCHPSDGVPRIGDARKRHGMNVSRRSLTSGLPCTTCHRSRNAAVAHAPPGVPNWHMPPEEHPMVFDGVTPHDLCVQLKDHDQNGGKSLAALRDHFAADPLVLWGWSPGPQRTTPPITHAQLVGHVDAWIAEGAPCPE